MKRVIFTCITFVLLLSACGSPQPTPLATATVTLTPTNTPIPTSTATPTTAVSMIEVDGVKVPDPKASNPELFDIKKPDSPIPQFISAMKTVGINTTSQQVLDAFSDPANFQVKTDTNGKLVAQFALATSKDGINYSMDFVYDSIKGQWREKNLIDDQPDFIGFSLSWWDNKLPNYETLIRDNAAYIFLGDIDQYSAAFRNVEYAQTMKSLQGERNHLYLHAAFYPKFDPEGLNKREDKEKYVNDRLMRFFSFVQKGQPATINLANETNATTSNGFDPSSILYQLYGNQALSEVYVKAYRIAEEMGLEVGKDIRFSISDSYVLGNVKQQIVASTLDRTFNEISKKLGLPRDKVQLDFAGQLRIDFDGGKRRAPSVEQFNKAVEQFKNIIGPNNRLLVTEIRVANTKAPEDIVKTLDPLLQAGLASGKIDALMFEAPLLIKDDPSFNENNIMLFDRNNHKAMFYYYLLSLLRILT